MILPVTIILLLVGVVQAQPVDYQDCPVCSTPQFAPPPQWFDNLGLFTQPIYQYSCDSANKLTSVTPTCPQTSNPETFTTLVTLSSTYPYIFPIESAPYTPYILTCYDKGLYDSVYQRWVDGLYCVEFSPQEIEVEY